MEKNGKGEMIGFISSILLIMLFGYTAISKILGHQNYVEQMKLAPVPLMVTLAPLLSWFVPLIELLIVIILLTERWRITGFYASLFLLIAFEIYISTMLLSGLNLPCTCGGLISTMGWKTHLAFNAFFIVIAAFPIIYKGNQNNEYSPHKNVRIDI